MINFLKNKTQLLTFLVIAALAISCKKDIDLPVSNCIAGTGGEVTFILQPEHHGDSIPSLPGYPDSAFIKFNANEFPGDNPDLYDLIVVGEEGEYEVIVPNMKCGNYFIYMTGKDESIDERVRGGIPVIIEQTTGEKTMKIPITED